MKQPSPDLDFYIALPLTGLFFCLSIIASCTHGGPKDLPQGNMFALPAELRTCEALAESFGNELKDQLLLQACLQERVLEHCMEAGVECLERQKYGCLEEFFEGKALDIRAYREAKCFLDLEADSEL